jgi:hypothetical protein
MGRLRPEAPAAQARTTRSGGTSITGRRSSILWNELTTLRNVGSVRATQQSYGKPV